VLVLVLGVYVGGDGLRVDVEGGLGVNGPSSAFRSASGVPSSWLPCEIDG